MNKKQKQANEAHINNIFMWTRDGGQWVWPDGGEVFTLRGNTLVGTRTGVEKLRRITETSFHSRLVVEL